MRPGFPVHSLLKASEFMKEKGTLTGGLQSVERSRNGRVSEAAPGVTHEYWVDFIVIFFMCNISDIVLSVHSLYYVKPLLNMPTVLSLICHPWW